MFTTSSDGVPSAKLGIEKHRNSFPLLYFYLEPAERSSALRPSSFGKLRIGNTNYLKSFLWKGSDGGHSMISELRKSQSGFI